MSLHDFMVIHREEILSACHARLRDENPDCPDLEQDLTTFFDEIVNVLRRDDGVDEHGTPPATSSAAAARLGERQQRAGLHPARVPLIFGAISQAIGQIGEHHELSIGADEYRLFNSCIDTGVATSIENYWNGEKAKRDQQITERFGYLAHEIRVAVGNAAMAFKLLRGGDLKLNGRTAEVLANNLVRLETLVARTLGSVQLDVGVPLEQRPIRVANVLRRLQASAIPERAVSIALEVDDTLHVLADEMLLTSAVSNLLHNAIKFTRSGGRIYLSCRAEPEGVVIEVEDECGGLPSGDPDELLQPFVRRGDHPQNCGLGLAITLRATQAMGGALAVQDRPGHGCVFRLTFPAARSASSHPPPLVTT